MVDKDDYSITESLLCGLAVAAAVSCAIYTGKLVYEGDIFEAMQSGGFTIVLLVVITDPINAFADLLTFPFKLLKPSGRRTTLTVIASLFGCALMLAGWLLE